MTNTARDQSDQVALANDGHGWPSPTARHAKPLSDAFYRTALASGSIVAPLDENAAVRRSDFWVGCVVCLIVAAGAGAFILAMVWK